MKPIYFAPMQGITDARFRAQHHKQYGGVAAYYAPFARVEHGRIRDKERKDLLPDRNRGVPTVPQVIVRDRTELAILTRAIENLGWRRIDINIGCPFPMQTHSGRGSGLLPYPDRIADILDFVDSQPNIQYSAKIRLGLTSPQECMQLLPLFNQSALTQITLHPRLGIQQYDGTPDIEAFEQFYLRCQKPLVYNGDLNTVQDIHRILCRFPDLSAVMIGRGLVQNPALAQSWQNE